MVLRLRSLGSTEGRLSASVEAFKSRLRFLAKTALVTDDFEPDAAAWVRVGGTGRV